MTIMSLPRFAVRPLRRAAVIQPSPRPRRPARPGRRSYRDAFFADPAMVEDDALRMRRRGAPPRPR